MERRSFDVDLGLAWRDARAGLKEWATALSHLDDNPVYLYLRARQRSAPASARLANTARVTGHFVALALLASFLWVGFNRPALAQLAGGRLWAVGIVLGALYLLWLANGIFQVASAALILLAPEGTAGRHELALDETMRSARLADRDFVVAFLVVFGQQLWARVWSLPLLVPGLSLLIHMNLQPAESANWYPLQVLSPISAADFLPGLIWLPLASGLLALNGWLVAQLLMLWLIALGRGVRQRWQIHAVALSLAVAQVAWGYLGLVHALTWRTFNGNVPINELLNYWLLPLLALALLVGSLHFSRRLSSLRYTIAVAAPALALVAILVRLQVNWGLYSTAGIAAVLSLNRWLMLTSSFALANPLILPTPGLLAIPHDYGEFYEAFHWFNIPLLLCFELLCLAICAHAARLSVADWRYSED